MTSYLNGDISRHACRVASYEPMGSARVTSSLMDDLPPAALAW